MLGGTHGRFSPTLCAFGVFVICGMLLALLALPRWPGGRLGLQNLEVVLELGAILAGLSVLLSHRVVGPRMQLPASSGRGRRQADQGAPVVAVREQAGLQIGRYRILGVLPPGGPPTLVLVGGGTARSEEKLATLYRARDEILGRDVTIKVLSPASPDEIAPQEWVFRRQRLLREATMLARLNHPNILAALDVGEHEGLLYIVFEPLEGMTLQEAIQTGMSLRAGLPIILKSWTGSPTSTSRASSIVTSSPPTS